jgi:hypothetical protein
VACDWGAGAQAGVLHRDVRRATLTERRETRTVALASFASRGPRSLLHHLQVRAEANVRCIISKYVPKLL